MTTMRSPLLGCASQYTVEIHTIRRLDDGGNPLPVAQMYFVGILEGVTRIRWGRILRDVSTAEITVDYINATPECCRLFAQVEARVSQVRIWRDQQLVWEGEVMQRIETTGSTQKSLVCRDVFQRLYDCANAQYLWFEDVPVTEIAAQIVEDNLLDEAFDDPVDSSLILPGLVVEDIVDPDDEISYRRGAVVDTVGELLRDLGQSYGLDFTVINRSLRLQRRRTEQDQTYARLTTEHLLGSTDVRVNGNEAGTMGWATTQMEGSSEPSEPDPDWPGITETAGDVGTRYGRIDVLRRVQDNNASEANVRRAAQQAIWNRNPPPTQVIVPTSATLSPSTPLTMRELIPGLRVDFYAIEGLCVPIRQGMRILTIDVEWTASRSEYESSENVAIGLSTLSDVTAAA